MTTKCDPLKLAKENPDFGDPDAHDCFQECEKVMVATTKYAQSIAEDLQRSHIKELEIKCFTPKMT